MIGRFNLGINGLTESKILLRSHCKREHADMVRAEAPKLKIWSHQYIIILKVRDSYNFDVNIVNNIKER